MYRPPSVRRAVIRGGGRSRDASGAPLIEFQTLGRIDLEGVEEDAARGVLRGPKRLGLLSYLALARPGGFVRRDTLVAMFWPDRDASRARHALRNTLYSLRQSLGREVVRGRGTEELAVDRGRLRCDAAAFRDALADGRRADALELYGGDLLPGLHVDGAAPAFERWLEEERRTLRRDARRAAAALSTEAEEEGRLADASRWQRRALTLDPYDEAALRRLMSLLAGAGNRGAALRAYHEFAGRMDRELGLEPGDESRELRAELRAAACAPVRDGEAAAGPAAAAGETAAAVGETTGVPAAREGAREERPAGGSGVPIARWGGGMIAASLALALALGAWLLAGSPRPWAAETAAEGPEVEGLSGELLAVFPFRSPDDAGGSLADGLAGLLATGLDGAGGVRTVDPRALASRMEGMDGDLGTASASDVAEELDAGLYVLGEGYEAGGELRLTAALYRPGSPTPVARAEVEGASDRTLHLIDRLAATLLTSAYPEAQLPLVRQAGRTTESLAALKDYLAGEQAFRVGRFAAASSAYRSAVTRDSSFALAWHRLSVTAEWLGNRDLAREGARRAVRHAERLVQRDRRLLEAHLTSLQGDASAAERQYRAILSTWPHDLEAWYQLGEIVFHYGPAVGRSLSEASEAFERVRSLHPTHVPSLVHLARIAAAEGRVEELEELSGQVLSLVPGSRHAWEVRALRAFVAEGAGEQRAVVAGLRDAGGESVRLAAWSVAVFGGRLEAGERLAGLMTASWRSPGLRELGRAWRAELAVTRGHWRRGWSGLPGLADGGGTAVAGCRSLLASLEFPPLSESVVGRLRAEVADSEGPQARLAVGLLSSRLGDFRRARQAARALERAGDGPEGVPVARLARIVRAHVAWRRGDAERAAALLGTGRVETRSAFMYGGELVQAFERYLRGRILADAGREEEALRWLGTFDDQHIPNLVYLAPSHLHRARLLKALGRPHDARRHYRAFLRLWSEPDPELAAVREEAERRLAALPG